MSKYLKYMSKNRPEIKKLFIALNIKNIGEHFKINIRKKV